MARKPGRGYNETIMGLMRRYLVDCSGDVAFEGKELSTRMPCATGDAIFFPGSLSGSPGTVLRLRISEGVDAPPPYDAHLQVEYLGSRAIY
jgi:hypothetical protein